MYSNTQNNTHNNTYRDRNVSPSLLIKKSKQNQKYSLNEMNPIEPSNDYDSSNNKSIYFILVYYYIGFILYFTLGSVLNLIVYFYMLYNIDDLNWNSKSITNNTNTTNTQLQTHIKLLGHHDTDTIDTDTIDTHTIDTHNDTNTIDTINIYDIIDSMDSNDINIINTKTLINKDLLDSSIV